MNSQKGMSAMVLAFALAAGACASSGVKLAPEPVLNKLDAACKASTMDFSGDVRDCFDAAVAAEENYRMKLNSVAGEGANVDYDLQGAVYRAAGSQYCRSAHAALNNWAIELGGAKGSMTNITRDGRLFGEMTRYFAESAQCYEEFRREFQAVKATELEADANRRARQASGIAGNINNKYNRENSYR